VLPIYAAAAYRRQGLTEKRKEIADLISQAA
jgi:hypothetical protein